MARQYVQINVVQDSSGAPVVVAVSWTSDGNVVKTHRTYLRQPGGYTLDWALVADLGRGALEVVRQALDEQQLF
jgi:hypothetical protein